MAKVFDLGMVHLTAAAGMRSLAHEGSGIQGEADLPGLPRAPGQLLGSGAAEQGLGLIPGGLRTAPGKGKGTAREQNFPARCLSIKSDP